MASMEERKEAYGKLIQICMDTHRWLKMAIVGYRVLLVGAGKVKPDALDEQGLVQIESAFNDSRFNTFKEDGKPDEPKVIRIDEDEFLESARDLVGIAYKMSLLFKQLADTTEWITDEAMAGILIREQHYKTLLENMVP